MPLDPSIILGAKPPVINPLEIMGQAANIQNARNQNRLFQAKALAGQYQEKSIDPATGRFDPQAYNRLLAADPRTAPYAMEARAAALANQGAGIANTAAQQGVTGTSTGFLNTDLGSVPKIPDPGGDPKNPTFNAYHQALLSKLQAGVASGRYTQDFANNYAGGGAGPDGTTLAQRAQEAAIAGATPNGMEAQFGSPTQINTGGDIQSENVNRVTGEVTPMSGEGATIPLTLSPTEKASGVSVIGADNAQHRISLGSLVDSQGNVLPGKGDVQTGLAPGVGEAGSAVGTASGQQLVAARQDAGGSPPRILALKKALTGLQSSNTGPGTNETNAVSSFLLAQTPEALRQFLPGVDPTKIKNYDEANKYLTQYAAASASAYGPGTDSKLATAASGNASTHISSLAAQDVVKVNIGLERMKQANVAAFEASGLPPQNYNSFSSNWSRSVDPRAFMADQQTAKERAKMFNSMSATEKANYRNGVRAALQSGVYGASDLPK